MIMEMEIENSEIECYDSLETLIQNIALEDEPPYQINNAIKVNEIYNVWSIRMNFYQIWSIMRCTLPNKKVNLEKDESCNLGNYYEYILVPKDYDDVFIIYSYGESFITIKEWFIGSTTLDENKIKAFIDHITDAVECYENGYKGMERLDFNSDNQKIHVVLQEIKENLIKNKKVLKEL